ncbi:epithelial membrane protein 3-like isoform X2 [Chamaea fasciata]|uniref:epithelial membrane protein 3-like isoform X2 n=1 Tax=Chamaea fasciata TaxID=190680 RepID=UPI00336A4C93
MEPPPGGVVSPWPRDSGKKGRGGGRVIRDFLIYISANQPIRANERAASPWRGGNPEIRQPITACQSFQPIRRHPKNQQPIRSQDLGILPPPLSPTMNFLPAAVTASHLLILLLFFIATLDKGWWVLSDARTLNLWYDCAPQNRSQGWECSSLGLSPLLRGVQGLMVAALLLSALGLLLFLWQLLGGPRGRLFLPSAAAQLLAGLAALVGAGLFAAWAVRAGDGHAGHCPTLAGLGGALALASGGGYLRLRTRE